MSLDGAKLRYVDESGLPVILAAKGRTFQVGSYLSCDLVLEGPQVEEVICEIKCDAFGRVTINNKSSKQPIQLNDKIVTGKRPLLHGARITILNKVYTWEFPKISEAEDVPRTPERLSPIEQVSNSCPSLKLHSHRPQIDKRLTVHNFRYCINSDDDGNTSIESRDQSDAHVEADESQRCKTPPNADDEPAATACQSPKVDLLDATQNKENTATPPASHKKLLKLCALSDVVITSFSPRETGVKTEKSFTCIRKPNTATVSTPKSVYSTPKSVLSELNEDSCSRDLLDFSTPSTSQKARRETSMHLIDLTTPQKLRLTIKQTPISVSDSADESSDVSPLVIDITKSETPPSPASSRQVPKTPKRLAAGATPKRTPQSLMKRALLTSTKKQIAANRVEATTPVGISKRTSMLEARRQCLTTPRRLPFHPQKRTPAQRAADQAKAKTPSTSPRKRPSLFFVSPRENKLSQMRKSLAVARRSPNVERSNKLVAKARRSLCNSPRDGSPKPGSPRIGSPRHESPKPASPINRLMLQVSEVDEKALNVSKNKCSTPEKLDDSEDELSRTFTIKDDDDDECVAEPKAANVMEDSLKGPPVDSPVSSDPVEEIRIIDDSICEEVHVDVPEKIENEGAVVIEDSICEEVPTDPKAQVEESSENSETNKENEASAVKPSPVEQPVKGMEKEAVPLPRRSSRRLSADQRIVATTPRRSTRRASVEVNSEQAGISQRTRRASFSSVDTQALATPTRKRRLTEDMGTPTRKSKRLLNTPKRANLVDESVGDMGVIVEETAPADEEKAATEDEDYGTELAMDEPDNVDYHGLRDMLKTPKNCSTPLFKGLRELMQTPRMPASPILGNIEELLEASDSVSQTPRRSRRRGPAEDAEGTDLAKILKTPSAKNIMVPNEPASTVLHSRKDYTRDSVVLRYDLSVGGLTLPLDNIFNDVPSTSVAHAEDTETEINVTTVSTATDADPLAVSKQNDSVSSEGLMNLSSAPTYSKTATTSTTYKAAIRADLELSTLTEEGNDPSRPTSPSVNEISGIQRLDQTSDSMFSDPPIVSAVVSAGVTVEETKVQPIRSPSVPIPNDDRSDTDSMIGLSEPLVFSDDEDSALQGTIAEAKKEEISGRSNEDPIEYAATDASDTNGKEMPKSVEESIGDVTQTVQSSVDEISLIEVQDITAESSINARKSSENQEPAQAKETDASSVVEATNPESETYPLDSTIEYSAIELNVTSCSSVDQRESAATLVANKEVPASTPGVTEDAASSPSELKEERAAEKSEVEVESSANDLLEESTTDECTQREPVEEPSEKKLRIQQAPEDSGRDTDEQEKVTCLESPVENSLDVIEQTPEAKKTPADLSLVVEGTEEQDIKHVSAVVNAVQNTSEDPQMSHETAINTDNGAVKLEDASAPKPAEEPESEAPPAESSSAPATEDHNLKDDSNVVDITQEISIAEQQEEAETPPEDVKIQLDAFSIIENVDEEPIIDRPQEAEADPTEESSEHVAPEESLIEDVPDQSLIEKGPEESLIEEVPDESLIDDVPEKSLIEKGPEESLIEEVPDETLIDDVTEKSLIEKNPEESLIEEVPDDSLIEEVPEKSLIDDVPEESLMEDVPEESFIEKNPEESLIEEVPDDSLIETVPEKSLIEDVPEESLIEKDPKESLIEEAAKKSLIENLPEESMIEEAPEESLIEKDPEVSLIEEVPDDSLIEVVPEQSLKEDDPEVSLIEDVPEKSLIEKDPKKSLIKEAAKESLIENLPDESMIEEAPEESLIEAVPEDSLIEEDLEEAMIKDVPEESRIEEAPEESLIENVPEKSLIEKDPEESVIEEVPEESLMKSIQDDSIALETTLDEIRSEDQQTNGPTQKDKYDVAPLNVAGNAETNDKPAAGVEIANTETDAAKEPTNLDESAAVDLTQDISILEEQQDKEEDEVIQLDASNRLEDVSIVEEMPEPEAAPAEEYANKNIKGDANKEDTKPVNTTRNKSPSGGQQSNGQDVETAPSEAAEKPASSDESLIEQPQELSLLEASKHMDIPDVVNDAEKSSTQEPARENGKNEEVSQLDASNAFEDVEENPEARKPPSDEAPDAVQEEIAAHETETLPTEESLLQRIDKSTNEDKLIPVDASSNADTHMPDIQHSLSGNTAAVSAEEPEATATAAVIELPNESEKKSTSDTEVVPEETLTNEVAAVQDDSTPEEASVSETTPDEQIVQDKIAVAQELDIQQKTETKTESELEPQVDPNSVGEELTQSSPEREEKTSETNVESSKEPCISTPTSISEESTPPVAVEEPVQDPEPEKGEKFAAIRPAPIVVESIPPAAIEELSEPSQSTSQKDEVTAGIRSESSKEPIPNARISIDDESTPLSTEEIQSVSSTSESEEVIDETPTNQSIIGSNATNILENRPPITGHSASDEIQIISDDSQSESTPRNETSSQDDEDEDDEEDSVGLLEQAEPVNLQVERRETTTTVFPSKVQMDDVVIELSDSNSSHATQEKIPTQTATATPVKAATEAPAVDQPSSSGAPDPAVETKVPVAAPSTKSPTEMKSASEGAEISAEIVPETKAVVETAAKQESKMETGPRQKDVHSPAKEELLPSASRRVTRKGSSVERTAATIESERPRRRGRKPTAEEPPIIEQKEADMDTVKKRGRKPSKEVDEAIPEPEATKTNLEKPKRRGRKPSAENTKDNEATTEERPVTAKRRGRPPSAEKDVPQKAKAQEVLATTHHTEERPVTAKRRGRSPSADKDELQKAKAHEILAPINEDQTENSELKKPAKRGRKSAEFIPEEHKEVLPETSKRRGRPPSAEKQATKDDAPPEHLAPNKEDQPAVAEPMKPLKRTRKASEPLKPEEASQPTATKEDQPDAAQAERPKRRGRKPSVDVELAAPDVLEKPRARRGQKADKEPAAKKRMASVERVDPHLEEIPEEDEREPEPKKLMLEGEQEEHKTRRRGRKPTAKTVDIPEEPVEASSSRRRGRKASEEEATDEPKPKRHSAEGAPLVAPLPEVIPEAATAPKPARRGRKPSVDVDVAVTEKKLPARAVRKPSASVDEGTPQTKKTTARRGHKASAQEEVIDPQLNMHTEDVPTEIVTVSALVSAEKANDGAHSSPSHTEDELTPRRREGRNIPRKNYTEVADDDKPSPGSRRNRKPVTSGKSAAPKTPDVEAPTTPTPIQKGQLIEEQAPATPATPEINTVTLPDPTTSQRREGRNLPRKNYTEAPDDDKPTPSRSRRQRNPTVKALELIVDTTPRPATPRRRKGKPVVGETHEEAPPVKESPEAAVETPAMATAASAKGRGTRREAEEVTQAESTEVEEAEPETKPTARKNARGNARKAKVGTESDPDAQPATKKARGGARAKTPVVIVSDDEPEPAQEHVVPVAAKKPAARGRARAAKAAPVVESVAEQETLSSKAAGPSAPAARGGRAKKVHFEATLPVAESAPSTDEAPKRATRSRRK
ncbi:titin isoform X3 [Drosophila guanche]|uniref:titin isoform X3 n=1 Tax=Drosophila guanche TaxID=7266 RepID=UPI001470C924|nr:titin isoform X3 [Drosophila guanche]